MPSIKILDAASATTFVETFNNASGTTLMASVPINPSGTAMVGPNTMANSLPVTIATDQASFAVTLGTGAVAIGTVSALQSGTWTVANAAGANAIGTVSALQSGTWTVANAAGSNAIGTVSALQSGTWTSQLGAGSNAIGTVSIAAGAAAIGTVSALQSGTWTVANAVSSNAIGTVSALQSGAWTVSLSGVSFAATGFATVAAASGTPAAVAVKNAAGTLYGANLYCNSTSYPVFMKIYNVTAASVSSATVPAVTVGIPGGAVTNLSMPSGGVTFTTAISYIITKLVGSTDTTAVAANDAVGWLTFV